MDYTNIQDESQDLMTRLFRKPKAVQIGTTSVRAPSTISLEQMYGGQKPIYQVPQQQAVVPTQALPQPETTTPTTGTTVTPEEAFVESGQWERITDNFGTEFLMPTNVVEGQVYQLESGTYTKRNGKWYQVNRGWDATGKYQTWVYSETQPFISEQERANIAGTEYGFIDTGTLQSDYDKLKSNYETLLASAGVPNITSLADIMPAMERIHENANDEYYGRRDTGKSFEEWRDEYVKLKNFYWENKDILEEYEDTLKGMEQTVGVSEVGEATITTSWQEQAESFFQDISDVDLIDENGMLDTTALRDMDNPLGAWYADVLDNSIKTGSLIDDFHVIDESGNLVINPELTNLVDTALADVGDQYDRMAKNMQLAAIQNGHSINDVFYSTKVADFNANVSMQMSQNMSNIMMREMESGYKYIANSLTNALRSIGRTTEAEAFATQMATAWTDSQESYQEKIDQMAEDLAEQKSTANGQIWTTIITAAASVIAAALFP